MSDTAATGHSDDPSVMRLVLENAELKQRLSELSDRVDEAESTIQAIRGGQVDAVVVSDGGDPRVFTLSAPERFYLRLAQEVANVGTWDWDLAAGTVTLSDDLKRLLEIHEPGSVAIDQWWNLVHSEDRERVLSGMAALMRSTDSDFYDEFRVTRGRLGLRWLASKGRVVRGLSGEPIRFIGINIDITERKVAEEALRSSERNFRELANSMPQIVWAAGPDGINDYFNRRWYEFTGLDDRVHRPDPWQAVLHPEDMPEFLRRWEESVSTGREYQVESRFWDVRRSEYRWYLTRALPVHNDRDEIVRWFGTCTGIHDQKQLQNTLREQDQRKDEFLAMLAHELRNPLSPLMAASELIGLDRSISPEVRELSLVLSRQTEQLKRLIDDLLDVSRISRGRLELHREPVALNQAVAAALDVSKDLVGTQQHTLTVDLPEEPLTVDGDKVRLSQIVGNLLINAAKYTPRGGQIHLHMRRDGGSAVISVRDNGIGIPGNMLNKVFGLFTQVDSSATRTQGGLGIGLMLVKTLVEMHGGSVTVTSEGDGRGSEFIVRLPLCEFAARDRIPMGDGEIGDELRPLQILVIDDNRSASHLLSRLLHRLGHSVKTADSAKSGLGMLEADSPDVLFSDIAMPDVSGYELARQVRAMPLKKRPVLVALTGYGQESDRQASLAAGFDRHLTKPVSLEVLQALLQSLPADVC
jgi:PAS domain S-box-containing protein